MEKENFLICPICKKSLFRAERSLKCDSGHSYDFSKSGYINLLNPGKMNNAKAGDSKEMISARTLFFSSGHYSPIREKMCDLVAEFEPRVIADAGCGEGYYTSEIARRLPDALVYGFDMSKFGCEHGAKNDKKCGITNTSFAVSNIFDMPLSNGCADAIINMFAPVAHEEFHRVLRSGGCFMVAAAGEKHLEGLKRAIYDEVYLNEVNVPSYDGFELIKRERLTYDVVIEGAQTIWALFQMTPYYHRTSLTDKEKLRAIDRLETTVDVDFFVFKKRFDIKLSNKM